jgi:alpha-ketoglutarate-dependent taurine dioxygenase
MNMQSVLSPEQPPTDLARPKELAAQLGAALRQHSLVRIQGPRFDPETREQWNDVARALGQPCFDGEDGVSGSQNGEMWSDVSYHPDRQHTFRHSCTAQPLHTDGAYLAEPADVIIFICERNAVSGGATIFVSAETIAQEAKEKDPELYDALFTLHLPYGKAGQRGRSAPVLTQHADGLYVNWNYYRVLKDESQRVHDFSERFRDFLRNEIVARNLIEPVTLSPGEALLFQDQRVLHGRTAFTPSPRCMWKCSVTRTAH